MADLIKDATQLVEWGSVPALATRVSIPNVNLLSKKGSILYGTGKIATSEASINGETYQYAEAKALSGVDDVNGKSVLFNDGGGNLSWTNVVDNLTTNDDNKVLSAQVGYDIDSKIHISEAKATPGITMGAKASTKYNSSIAIGSNAIEGNNTGFSTILGNSASIDGATDCIAIGNGARISQTGTRRYSSIQLGNGTNTTPYSFQVWNTPMLIDGKIPLSTLSPTITVNEQTGLVLSNGQTGYTMSYDGTVVLGPQALATGQEGVAIGAQAVARGTGVAIGGGAVGTMNGGVAIGNSAFAEASGVAIGVSANASINGVAIGSLAVAGENVIQLGTSESTFSFRVGNFDVMGKDGQILAQRLTNALSSIYQRLDDLGFKEGAATYTTSGNGITVQNNSLQKMGKWCIFNFKVHMKGARGSVHTINITIPSGFRPKTNTIIKLGLKDTTVKSSTGAIDTITWKASDNGADETDFVYYNAWWELP